MASDAATGLEAQSDIALASASYYQLTLALIQAPSYKPDALSSAERYGSFLCGGCQSLAALPFTKARQRIIPTAVARVPARKVY